MTDRRPPGPDIATPRRLPVVLPPPRSVARHWNEALEKYDEGPPSEEERIEHAIEQVASTVHVSREAVAAAEWQSAWRRANETADVLRVALRVVRDHLRRAGDTLADDLTEILDQTL